VKLVQRIQIFCETPKRLIFNVLGKLGLQHIFKIGMSHRTEILQNDMLWFSLENNVNLHQRVCVLMICDSSIE